MLDKIEKILSVWCTHTHTQGKLTEGKHKEVARNKNEIMIQSYYLSSMEWMEGFPGGSVGKELACNAGDAGDLGSILGSGRSPGGGHSNPLQDSCLENPMDRGAWWTTVHRVAKSQTRLKRLSTHTQNFPFCITPYILYMGFPDGSVVKNPMQETQVQSLGQEDPLE